MNPESVAAISRILNPVVSDLILEYGNRYVTCGNVVTGVLEKSTLTEFPFRDSVYGYLYKSNGRTSNVGPNKYDICSHY